MTKAETSLLITVYGSRINQGHGGLNVHVPGTSQHIFEGQTRAINAAKTLADAGLVQIRDWCPMDDGRRRGIEVYGNHINL